MPGREVLIHCGLNGLSAARCLTDGRAVPLEEALATAAAGATTTVLLDSRDLYLADMALPTRRARTARAAAPFAIEENLASDVDTLCITVGKGSGARYPVAAVSREQLDNLLEQLAMQACYPDLLTPDVLALPLDGTAWSLAECGDALLVRTGRNTGFACDIAVAEPILARALPNPTPPVAAYGRFTAVDCEVLAGRCGLDVTRHEPHTEALELMAQTEVPSGAINLLPSDAQQPRSATQPLARAALWIFALTALLHLTNLGLERSDLGAQIDVARQAIETSFLEVAPPGSPVRSPIEQLTALAARLEREKNRTDLFDLLASLAGAPEPAQLTDLRFENDETEIAVAAASAGQVEDLARHLERQGQYRARVLAADTSGAGTRGTLMVTPEQ